MWEEPRETQLFQTLNSHSNTIRETLQMKESDGSDKTALAFLTFVKEIFLDNRERYEDFIEILLDFKQQRVDISFLIKRVNYIFKGHPIIISAFNYFLPNQFANADVAHEQPFQPIIFEEIVSFVMNVKAGFQGLVFCESCLKSLDMYKKERSSILDVYPELVLLFKDNTDLLEEFTKLYIRQNCFGRSSICVKFKLMSTREISVSPHEDHDLSSPMQVE